jgi:hypothetical protein
MRNLDIEAAVEILKTAIDASIAFEALPARFERTRNGWAGYKGATRITKFFFSETGAREAVTAWDASDIRIQF